MLASRKLVSRPLSSRGIIIVSIYHTPRAIWEYFVSDSFELGAIIRICKPKSDLISRVPPFVHSGASPSDLLILPLLRVLAKSTETEKHWLPVCVASYAVVVSLILVIRHAELKSLLVWPIDAA
jgi:hypothetical protein